MTKLLVRLFIKDYKNVSDEKVRGRYGIFSGAIGIISNAILVAIKIIVGLVTSSISIIADGINNLSDAGSSIVTMVGFKLSQKEADEEHPFGHERIEYISGLIVSMIILIIGGNFLITSIQKIFNPGDISLGVFAIALLGVSIVIKIWQSMFYRYMGKKIDSTVLMASSRDSLNDCISTAAVLISCIVMYFTNVNIDAYMGCLVSLFIIYSGISMIIDSANPLIGNLPSKEYVDKLLGIVLENEQILGYHDLVIHSYGPEKFYGTIHLEFAYNEDVLKIHEIIDNIEKTVFAELKMELVVHMDPIINDDPYTNMLKEKVLLIIQNIDNGITMHDFRIVKGVNVTKVLFDCVLPVDLKPQKQIVREKLTKEIKKIDNKFECIIVFDTRFLYK